MAGPSCSPAITSPQFAQCWSLDETGNWSGFRQSDNGSTWTLEQERAANEANEIADIANTVGSSWSQPAYDPAGNMTTVPRPAAPGSSYTATYDAWNRLVKLQAGGQTVQENAYDARNFRVIRKDYNAGILTETRHAYFTDSWQVVEERLGSSTSPDRHFVWGQRYLDDLILRDRTTGGTLSERLYALQDANWNVTALTNTSGSVQERYEYDPYGQTTVLTATFGSRGTSSYGWETTYAGYRWDGNTGLFAVRNRYYNATLGTWISRDPIPSHFSLYQYGSPSPITTIDPFGLEDVQLTFDPNNVFSPAQDSRLELGAGLGTFSINDFRDFTGQNIGNALLDSFGSIAKPFSPNQFSDSPWVEQPGLISNSFGGTAGRLAGKLADKLLDPKFKLNSGLGTKLLAGGAAGAGLIAYDSFGKKFLPDADFLDESIDVVDTKIRGTDIKGCLNIKSGHKGDGGYYSGLGLQLDAAFKNGATMKIDFGIQSQPKEGIKGLFAPDFSSPQMGVNVNIEF